MSTASMRQTNAGFTLIELMIGLTIGLILLTALTTLFSTTSGSRLELDRASRLMENSRFAADIVGDDIRHAGFYGTVLPPSDTVYTDSTPCVWDVADLNLLGWQPNATPPRYPAQLIGWDDPIAGDATLGCLPNRIAGTDVLVVRRVSSETVTLAQIDVRNVYVQASQCITDPTLLRVSNIAANFTLRTVACDPAVIAPIRRYFIRAYYLASCNECAPSDGIPTLKRVEIIDNAVRVVSLAEGVINMQMEYAFDTNGDGSAEVFLTSTTPDTTPTSLWSNVVAVRFHMLMRSTEGPATAQTSPGTYDLGPGHTAERCPEGFKCRLVSTTMRMNNVAGRRES